MWKILCLVSLVAGLVMVPYSAMASEDVGGGEISSFYYRNGFIYFKLTDGSGVNKCASCDAKANGMGAGFCWVPTTNEALISMVLTTHSQSKENIPARVTSWTSCEIYQYRIPD